MDRADEYSVAGHGRMLRDSVRLDAYLSALDEVIRPNSRVLDIGTGLGVLAVAAAQRGAKSVVGIEHDRSVYVARAVVEDNHQQERVMLIRGSALEVALDERADIVVSDLRGVLPMYGRHLEIIADARQRHATRNAVFIPMRDTLWVGLANSAEAYAFFDAPWKDGTHDIDLGSVRPYAINTWRQVHARTDELVSGRQQWATLDYAGLESMDVEGDVTFAVDRAAICNGLLVWFDATLTGSVGYSNSPGASGCVYGQGFFPLGDPLSLRPGDTVRVELSATCNGTDYIWSWGTQQVRQATVIASSTQSTLNSQVFSP